MPINRFRTAPEPTLGSPGASNDVALMSKSSPPVAGLGFSAAGTEADGAARALRSKSKSMVLPSCFFGASVSSAAVPAGGSSTLKFIVDAALGSRMVMSSRDSSKEGSMTWVLSNGLPSWPRSMSVAVVAFGSSKPMLKSTLSAAPAAATAAPAAASPPLGRPAA